MPAHRVVRPRSVGLVMLVFLLLALLAGCAAASGETTDGDETTGGETTGDERTSDCPQTTGGGQTTSGERTSDCPQTADGSQAGGGTKEQAAGPRVTRRGSDLLRPSFVGEVQGTSAFIGIAFPGSTIPTEGPDEGMEVIVFIADGDPNQMGLRGAYGEWFRGSINEEGAIDSLDRKSVV